MDATDARTACFEAGIKFGSLYHQFAGTPVTPESAASLERAMEEAIENQPYCTGVEVDVLTDVLADHVAEGHEHGYAELTGRLFEAELVVEYGDVTVRARMATEEGYPRMRLVSIDE